MWRHLSTWYDGLTITVSIDPADTMRPVAELFDANDPSLATVTAAAAGHEVVLLQTIATTGSGTYTVAVGEADARTEPLAWTANGWLHGRDLDKKAIDAAYVRRSEQPPEY